MWIPLSKPTLSNEPAPKKVYTLHPRSSVMDMIMLAFAVAFIAGTFWLALAAGNQ